MSNDRARQKKLEKQKAKRTEVKRAAIEQARPLTRGEIERGSGDWPLVGVHVGADWRELGGANLVSMMIVRRAPRHVLVGCSVLIDRTCLGVKNGFARPMRALEIESYVDRLAEHHHGIEAIPIATAQAIVFHAIDYAKSLGFSPHPDFPVAFLGPRPAILEETAWAHPSEPFYVAGPDDDVAAIMRKLGVRGQFIVPMLAGAPEEPAIVAAIERAELEAAADSAASSEG